MAANSSNRTVEPADNSLSASWRHHDDVVDDADDDNFKFEDVSFMKSSEIGPDLNDPETVMKEKRGSKRTTLEVTGSSALPMNENSMSELHIALPELSLSEQLPSFTQEFDINNHNASIPTQGQHAGIDSTYNIQSQPQPTNLPKPMIHISGPAPARPVSSSSGPSSQDISFTDFDGVHFSHPNEAHINNFSPTELPKKKPGLVYYPAPVPMMLNLPRKLRNGSGPASDRFAKGAPINKNAHRDVAKRRDPQGSLKLSEPGITNGSSAVATLESILDAAAGSSPSTFVEHPMAPSRLGHKSHGRRDSVKPELDLGDDGAVKSRKRITSRYDVGGASARPGQGGEEDLVIDGCNKNENEHYPVTVVPPSPDSTDLAIQRNNRPDNIDYSDEERSEDEVIHHSDDSDDDDNVDLDLNPPSNLLAELETRKAKQRLRTRNAASAFPIGLRSTLLELDAVAEIERETRRKGQTALQWQMNDNVQKAQEDDDVPLGVLYPTSTATKKEEASNPRGLLAVREFEENEPLSRRRQRLQTDLGIDSRIVQQNRLTQYSTGLGLGPAGSRVTVGGMATTPPGGENEKEEEEEETLGSRKKRLQASQAFETIVATANDRDDDEAEEPLAKRKQRLKDQSQKQPSVLNPAGQDFVGFLDSTFDTSYVNGGHPINQTSVSGYGPIGLGATSTFTQGYHGGQQHLGATPYFGQPGQPYEADARSREIVERWRTNVW